MAAPSLIFQFVVSLSVITIVVWGVPTVTNTVLTLSDKTDEEGYHMTCHASKPSYKNFHWRHSMEDCSKNSANFHPLQEDKYNRMTYSQTDDELLSTLTLVGSTGKEDGPKHCVCCGIENDNSICVNLTMQHAPHQHAHHHHHHHHHHH